MKFLPLAATILTLLLSACGGIGVAKHSYCELTSFFYIGKEDRITKELADELLAHNLLRQELCR